MCFWLYILITNYNKFFKIIDIDYILNDIYLYMCRYIDYNQYCQ